MLFIYRALACFATSVDALRQLLRSLFFYRIALLAAAGMLIYRTIACFATSVDALRQRCLRHQGWVGAERDLVEGQMKIEERKLLQFEARDKKLEVHMELDYAVG